jgi:hypothetical protein
MRGKCALSALHLGPDTRTLEALLLNATKPTRFVRSRTASAAATDSLAGRNYILVSPKELDKIEQGVTTIIVMHIHLPPPPTNLAYHTLLLPLYH